MAKTPNNPPTALGEEGEGLRRSKPTEILILTDDFLPLSVRESAKRAAVAVVESWRACKTYDEWSNRDA
jgi:hypothetical protein